MQKDILEKTGEIIKKDQGIYLEKLTNREKTILIDALRPKYKLSQLLSVINIPKSSYCYHKKQLSLPDKYRDVRTKIIDIFEKNKRRYGYRRIHATLKSIGIVLSEKVVRQIMREENLIAKTIKMKKYSSYLGEIFFKEILRRINQMIMSDGYNGVQYISWKSIFITNG